MEGIHNPMRVSFTKWQLEQQWSLSTSGMIFLGGIDSVVTNFRYSLPTLNEIIAARFDVATTLKIAHQIRWAAFAKSIAPEFVRSP